MSMGKKIMLFVGIMVITVMGNAPAHAQNEDVFNSSGLEIPRFVSLRSEKVFVRTGPALRYPIKWVFQMENLPVEVVQEFDTWRKIKDHTGEEGWVHQSLTQGRRFGVVQNPDDLKTPVPVYKKAESGSAQIALFEPNVIVKLEECGITYCKVTKSGFDGWVERKFLWGIYADEKFD